MNLFSELNDDQLAGTPEGGKDSLAEGISFAAPPRAGFARKSSKKGLWLLLLFIIGGVGGGYFYLASTEEKVVRPPIPTAALAPVGDVKNGPAGQPPSPVVQLAQNSVQPVPLADQTAVQPAAGVVAAEKKNELTIPAMPPQPGSKNDAVATAVNITETALPPPVSVPAPPPPPVVTEAQANALPMPPPPSPPMVPAGTTAPAASREAMPVAAGTAPVIPEMPAVQPAPDQKAPPAPKAAEKYRPDMAAPVKAGTVASPAELAIVQNAAVLDSLAPPTGASKGGSAVNPDAGLKVGDILATPANVRPLPQRYLVLKKEHEAGDVDSRLSAARLALSQGRDQAAFEIFDSLYKTNKQDGRVAMGRAVALQRMGQISQALSAYEGVLKTNPKNIEALTNMLGLLKTKDSGTAIEKLKQLMDIYPSNADITAQLGMMYGVSGDYTKALKYLEMADALKPGNPNILYNRAVVYDRMGMSIQAAELYHQLVLLAGDGSLDQNFPIEAVRKRLAVIR